MGNKNNVVDLSSRRRQQQGDSIAPKQRDASILDLSELRHERIVEERRKVRRTILKEFIGAYVVIPDQGLQKVTIYDISDGGLSVDIALDVGRFSEGEEVAMRLYLSQNTYFPFTVTVQNGRIIDVDQVYRHGCRFVKGLGNEEALRAFVKFVESVSGSLRTDKGDMMSSRSR